MSVKFTGQLVAPQTTEIKHNLSGALIKTTAPVDNGGDGSCFSPTDLFASSLGACGTTIMSLYATKSAIPLENIHFEVEKIMDTAPRRVSKIIVQYFLKTNCTEEEFKKLVAAGKSCPVKVTIQNVVQIQESYIRV
jgi:uncharacterized OsmC-like protein